MRNNLIISVIALLLLSMGGAFAQIEENFSDGNFTDSPTWSGDTDKFVVAPYALDASNLMLRSNSGVAGTYYLSTPSSIVEDTFWEFFINPRYQVSSANIVDVYLVADNANLSSVQNGYFLRFGRTTRDISFWKLQNGSEQLLLEGPASQVNSSSNNPFNIRITRNLDGLWSVFTDPGATGTFQTLGLVTDGDIVATVAFGLRIVQSTAQGPINNHWFDNFTVAPIPPDLSLPQVISAEAISATEVLLTFNEPLDVATAENAFNYALDGGIGNPVSAVLDPDVLVEVTLNFGTALEEGLFYTLSATEVQDLAGNAMAFQQLEVVWFVISQAGFREIVFNELMADENPSVGLPLAEFIEVHNTTSDKFFNLAGYTYVNGSTAQLLAPAVLFPGSYLILSNVSNAAQFEPYGDVLGLASFPSLTNGGDSLTLLNLQGALVDVVSYSLDWYQDPNKSDGGWTLEQINPTTECSGMANWRASENPQGGSPGAVNSIFDDSPDAQAPLITGFQQVSPSRVRIFFNEAMDEISLQNGLFNIIPFAQVTAVIPATDLMSVDLEIDNALQVGVTYTLTISGLSDCSGNPLGDNTVIEILFGEKPQFGDLIISELMADPSPAVGLPAQEYFELFNASDKVLDLQGCNFSGLSFLSPRLLMPGNYLMCISSSAIDDFQAFPEAYVMQGMSLTFLTNSGRELALNNQDGMTVNALNYSAAWYIDPSKADGGWSLEIINPFTGCSGAQNWRASNAIAGGTPGAQNSVYNDSPDTNPPTITGFFLAAPDQLMLIFNELMDVASLQEGLYLFEEGVSVVEVIPQEPPLQVLLLLGEVLVVGTEYTLLVGGLLDCSLNALPENELLVQVGEAPGLYDLLISEIMPDPTPAIGMPEEEYFELYNASDKVIELQGCELSGLSFERGRLVQPGAYVLCAGEGQFPAFFAYANVYRVPNMSSTFLTNSGRELLLSNPDGDLVDRVKYNLSWYNDLGKDDGGWSMERINLDEPCRAGDNWTASVAAQGGTPQAENSVNSDVPDLVSPVPLAALVQSPTEIELRFNEVIDPESLLTATFEIGTISVIGVEALLPSATAVVLTLGSALQAGSIYILEVSDVADCLGNVMGAAVAFNVALAEEASVGDLLINEVLFNVPSGGSEFIELYNVSEKAIGLQNWTLTNQSGTSNTLTTDPLVIFPKQYMVFTTVPDVLFMAYPQGNQAVFIATDIPSLTNSGGSVIINNAFQVEMDRFDYQEDYHLSLLQSYQGVSLERLSFTRPTNEAGNWTSAAENVGFATPGFQNSQYLPEGTASGSFELENEVFSPDNDGFQDVLLINYKLDVPGFIANVQIFDRRGRMVRKLTSNEVIGTQGTLSWDGTTDTRAKARIGPHIVYIELFDLNGNTEQFKLPCIVAGRLGG